jgi:hypothetical protein
MADGAWIGAGAGVAYAIVIAFCGSIGGKPSFSGFVGLAVVGGLVAVLTGVMLGAGSGLVFGGIALTKVPRLPWVEASVVAILGAVLILLAISESGGANSATLAWTGGPLVAGVPGAALHGYRLQRRVSRREGGPHAGS